MVLFALKPWVLVSRTGGGWVGGCGGWGGSCSAPWGEQAVFSPPEPHLLSEAPGVSPTVLMEKPSSCAHVMEHISGVAEVEVKLFSGSAGHNRSVNC